MDPDGGNHEPNRKGYHREVGSEGSGTQLRPEVHEAHRRHSFLGEGA